MKKRVTLVLEVESDDEYMLRDDVIERDLQREINCACNSYEMVDFKTKVVKETETVRYLSEAYDRAIKISDIAEVVSEHKLV